MKNTIETLKAQAEKVNRFFKREIFEIGQRNNFKYFDFVDCSKTALFNSGLSNKEMAQQIDAFYEGLIFKDNENTKHFICTVYDSIYKGDEIGAVFCDVNNIEEAKAEFLTRDFIKRHLNKDRYKIIIRQNPVLLQDYEN
jgi:hypothetical protein